MSSITRIIKRDGRTVNFDQNKIAEAIWKAAQSVGGTDRSIAERMGNQVATVLEIFFKDDQNLPNVEQIQDLVEKILIENGHAKTAKAYIIYREEHARLRQEKAKILGTNDSVILTFPKNATLESVKELIELAEKLGCSIITPASIAPRTQEIHIPKTVSLAENGDQDEQKTLFKEGKETRPHRSIEEVIPPPLEIMA